MHNDPKPETRSAPFMLRLRPTVKAAGERCAADDNRSLAGLMEMLLIRHLRETGYLPAAGGE
jgi:hypothetical protein